MPVGTGRERPAGTTRTAGWMAVAVSLLTALLLTGCSGAGGRATEGASGGSWTRCPDAYPIRLPITTAAASGVPPLYRLRACAADARLGPVLLMNNGNAAWTTVAPGHEFNLVQGNEQATWLRDRVAVPPGLVLPQTAIVVHARPAEVTWTLSREWTVGWASVEAALHTLASHGRDTVTRAMAADSPRGQAVISCALTAYHLYRTASGDPLPAHDGFGTLEMTWSAAPTACAADWQLADRFLERRGVRATTWSLAVLRADAWVSSSRRALSWLDAGGDVTIGVR